MASRRVVRDRRCHYGNAAPGEEGKRRKASARFMKKAFKDLFR
jgi:hypothetical protein